MKLNEGEIGRTYLVKNVTVDAAVTRRLEALGVNEMTPITVLNKKGSGSVIFKVRGTRLAVGRRISEGILMEETECKKEEKHSGFGTANRINGGGADGRQHE